MLLAERSELLRLIVHGVAQESRPVSVICDESPLGFHSMYMYSPSHRLNDLINRRTIKLQRRLIWPASWRLQSIGITGLLLSNTDWDLRVSHEQYLVTSVFVGIEAYLVRRQLVCSVGFMPPSLSLCHPEVGSATYERMTIVIDHIGLG